MLLEVTHLADSSFFIVWAVFSLALMYCGLFLFSSTSCQNRHINTSTPCPLSKNGLLNFYYSSHYNHQSFNIHVHTGWPQVADIRTWSVVWQLRVWVSRQWKISHHRWDNDMFVLQWKAFHDEFEYRNLIVLQTFIFTALPNYLIVH